MKLRRAERMQLPYKFSPLYIDIVSDSRGCLIGCGNVMRVMGRGSAGVVVVVGASMEAEMKLPWTTTLCCSAVDLRG